MNEIEKDWNKGIRDTTKYLKAYYPEFFTSKFIGITHSDIIAIMFEYATSCVTKIKYKL